MKNHIRVAANRFYTSMLLLPLIIAVFISALSATATGAEEKFSVLEFSPQGLVTGSANIRIDFSAPVITSADIGTSPQRTAMPVVFSPAIEGQGVWISRGTFVYQLRGGYLPEATEFTATIPDGVRDASGTPISGIRTFNFNTAPLEFLGIRQVDYRMDREVQYELSFNAPVNVNHFRSFINVRDHRGDPINFGLDNTQSSNSIILRVIPGDGSPITVDIGAGLTSARGPLPMEDPVSVTVDRDLSLRITGSYASNYYYGSQTGIVIRATTEIDAIRASSFVEITPKHDFTISARGSEFFIAGDFPPRELITVKLKSGLPAIYGAGLSEDWERSFIFPDYSPAIEFAATGRFISPANEELLIPFTSVNMRNLNISVGRVYDNNVAFVTKDGWPFNLRNETEMIYESEYEISSEPNKNFDFSFDLGKVLNGRTGLFVIQADSPNYWPSASRVINVTDIAGSAKIGPDSALVWANSISQGKPAEGVSVDIYSISNQLIASGVTDEHGVALVIRDSDWDVNLQPNTVILQKDGDVSVLRLEGNIWQTGNAEYIGVPYNRRQYVGFIFTPRGIFRPGEEAPLRMLVRNADLSPEAPFPVQVKVYNSMGREWASSTVMTSEFGMASAGVIIGDAGPTGTWRAEVLIPGETIPLATGTFLVEDFAPPKIEVTVSSDQTELRRNDSVTLDIFAQYLFGAAGSELAYEVETSFIPREYTHPNRPGYSFFSDHRVESAASNNIAASGTLARDGTATATLPPITNRARSILDAVFTVGVREDGGRWVYKNLTMPYYPNDMMLGIKYSAANLSTNTAIPFAFAAIDTEGNAVNPEGVTLSAAREITRSITTAAGGGRRSELRTETIPLAGFDKKPIFFEDGETIVELSFSNQGNYIVSLEDAENETYAAVRFFVYDAGWGYGGVSDATLPESLNIILDKDIYTAGDTARAIVSGSFEGTVLFSVETDKVLHYDTSPNKGNSVEFSFDVTHDMTPNAWVTAHLVRAAAPEDSWSAHRAFGAVPIFIDRSDLKLDVEVTAPDEIKPGEINIFSVRLTDSEGKGTPGEFSMMLVDEGALGLTNFRTPNFFDSYTQKRALSLNAYDIYTELMPLYLHAPPVLTAGGGDDDIMSAALRASMAPVRADRFRILTVVMDVKTDENGMADVVMDVPEFSGRARLMTVASSRGAFGASEQSAPIARDIVADITLPRALAPGDVFSSQIQLFNRTDSSIDASITLKIDGPVSIVSAAEKQLPDEYGAEKTYADTVSVPAGEEAFSIPLLLKADDDSGVVEVTLVAQYGDTVLSQDIELAVRPPYPRITETGSFAVQPNASIEFSLPEGWFPGTRRALLSMSGLPSISLADAAQFLLDYPYSCTEQIISRGWTLLAAPELASRIDPRLAARSHAIEELAGILRRIQSMQLYNGSFSPWEMHPSSQWLSVYAAHFLVACEREGVDVPRETLRNALEYLRFLMAETPDSFDGASFGAALSVRAYITYVLALKGESPLAWMSYLRNNLESIPDYGRLLLAAAYAQDDKQTASSLAHDDFSAVSLYESNERPNMDSPLRTRALYLLVWNEIDPTSPQAASAAANLLASLRKTVNFTTQEAGWALLALSSFFSRHPSDGEAFLVLSSPASDLRVENSGDSFLSQFIPEEISSLQVKNSGTGPGYVNWTVSGVPIEPPTPVSIGMNVSARYFNSEGFEISDGAVLNGGERVTARITIRPFGGVLRNLIVALPLAGGLEIENPRTIQQPEPSYESSGRFRDTSNTFATTRTESRDDRFLLFVDNIDGEFSWTLTLRAITPGTFILPPIAAEGMYSPGIRSVGTTSVITIR